VLEFGALDLEQVVIEVFEVSCYACGRVESDLLGGVCGCEWPERHGDAGTLGMGQDEGAVMAWGVDSTAGSLHIDLQV
jgi:hypothetical protein